MAICVIWKQFNYLGVWLGNTSPFSLTEHELQVHRSVESDREFPSNQSGFAPSGVKCTSCSYTVQNICCYYFKTCMRRHTYIIIWSLFWELMNSKVTVIKTDPKKILYANDRTEGWIWPETFHFSYCLFGTSKSPNHILGCQTVTCYCISIHLINFALHALLMIWLHMQMKFQGSENSLLRGNLKTGARYPCLLWFGDAKSQLLVILRRHSWMHR